MSVASRRYQLVRPAAAVRSSTVEVPFFVSTAASSALQGPWSESPRSIDEERIAAVAPKPQVTRMPSAASSATNCDSIVGTGPQPGKVKLEPPRV